MTSDFSPDQAPPGQSTPGHPTPGHPTPGHPTPGEAPDTGFADPLAAGVDDDRASQVLADWIADRRWFAGKARSVASAEVAATVRLGDDLVDVLLDVHFTDGGVDRYQLPLVRSSDREAADLVLPLADGSEALLTDAVTDPASVRRLASLAASVVDLDAGRLGVVRGSPVPGVRARVGDSTRVMRGEQSNSSVVITGEGPPLILKVLRRLEQGQHPDVEVTRALTEEKFDHVPAQIGALELDTSGTPTALAVLSAFVAGATDGFEGAVEETTALVSDPDAPTPMLARFELLGEVIGSLHRLLTRLLPRTAAGPAELSTWSHEMREQLATVTERSRERAPDAADRLAEVTHDLRDAIDGVRSLPLAEVGLMIRIHGDLHLGQTLWHDEVGWQILDFEGEPAKSVEERRRPSSPLRDVAGMLRSFDYAAAMGAVRAGEDPSSLPDSLVRWREEARRRFLSGYAATAPQEVADLEASAPLLVAFELDKAVYELGYELANRPSWVPIPLAGIIRAVERRRSGVDDDAPASSAPPNSDPQTSDPQDSDPA